MSDTVIRYEDSMPSKTPAGAPSAATATRAAANGPGTDLRRRRPRAVRPPGDRQHADQRDHRRGRCAGSGRSTTTSSPRKRSSTAVLAEAVAAQGEAIDARDGTTSTTRPKWCPLRTGRCSTSLEAILIGDGWSSGSTCRSACGRSRPFARRDLVSAASSPRRLLQVPNTAGVALVAAGGALLGGHARRPRRAGARGCRSLPRRRRAADARRDGRGCAGGRATPAPEAAKI